MGWSGDPGMQWRVGDGSTTMSSIWLKTVKVISIKLSSGWLGLEIQRASLVSFPSVLIFFHFLCPPLPQNKNPFPTCLKQAVSHHKGRWKLQCFKKFHSNEVMQSRDTELVRHPTFELVSDTVPRCLFLIAGCSLIGGAFLCSMGGLNGPAYSMSTR